MNQIDNANHFKSLHVPGSPLFLYNAWDAGSAQTIARAGAAAVATSSWSIAAAQGYQDGQVIPLDFVIAVLERIVASVDVPVTVDFEGGYAEDAEPVAENVSRLLAFGVAGINFEDGRTDRKGLYSINTQVNRIRAIRTRAEKERSRLFINARTDLFLRAPAEEHENTMEEAKERVHAYADAGASGIFIPGLIDESLIRDFCRVSPVPVNIMMMVGAPSILRLAELGVARVSFGPIPYLRTMETLEVAAQEAAEAA